MQNGSMSTRVLMRHLTFVLRVRHAKLQARLSLERVVTRTASCGSVSQLDARDRDRRMTEQLKSSITAIHRLTPDRLAG
jgi:hypothetical protein